MTDDRIALQTLLAKQPDADIVREMLGFAAERLMELEVQGKTGAAQLVLSDAAGGVEGDVVLIIDTSVSSTTLTPRPEPPSASVALIGSLPILLYG